MSVSPEGGGEGAIFVQNQCLSPLPFFKSQCKDNENENGERSKSSVAEESSVVGGVSQTWSCVVAFENN